MYLKNYLDWLVNYGVYLRTAINRELYITNLAFLSSQLRFSGSQTPVIDQLLQITKLSTPPKHSESKVSYTSLTFLMI
jgi:hypothetical protein